MASCFVYKISIVKKALDNFPEPKVITSTTSSILPAVQDPKTIIGDKEKQ